MICSARMIRTFGMATLLAAIFLSALGCNEEPKARQTPMPVWEGPFDVETKLTASDAAAGDIFGISVAISGNTAIVGARFDDDAGHHFGSAYLFDVSTGNELFKLTVSDGARGGYFGRSVAICGNTAIVGAKGSAYLFDVTTGEQLFKLTASDGASHGYFGASVAISGSRAIVGTKFDDDGGIRSGSAYLFDVTTGNQLFKLTASDAAKNAWFGFSVAISDNTAIIGAKHDDGGGGHHSGSAYLFDVTTGNQLFKLTASDASRWDSFGISVAISGNTAIVGASISNSAYLFDVATGNELFMLTSSDGAAVSKFGFSVAISDNTAIVGAYDFQPPPIDHPANPIVQPESLGCYDSGMAYLFDVTTGDQLSKLAASDAATGDLFGESVGISGNTAIVGAPAADDGVRNSGSAYLFTQEP